MKFSAIFIGLLIGCAVALPTNDNVNVVDVVENDEVATTDDASRQARFIESIVANIIEGISQQIRDMGYDPIEVRDRNVEFKAAVPEVVSADVNVEEFLFVGLSDIVINRMSYNIFTSRLIFDVTLPEISLSIRGAHANMLLLRENYKFAVDGKLTMRNIGASGRVRVSIGIVSGVTLSNAIVEVYLGEIRSEMNTLELFNYELADCFNDFINVKVTNSLTNNNDIINELVNIIVNENL